MAPVVNGLLHEAPGTKDPEGTIGYPKDGSKESLCQYPDQFGRVHGRYLERQVHMTFAGFWFDQAWEATGGATCETLRENITADVCIVGGGFLGMWTAIHLKEADPSTDVVIVERAICGSGASGRNGGLGDTWWVKLQALVDICGVDEARRLAHATDDTVRYLGDFTREKGIDIEYRCEGRLWCATSPAQVGIWNSTMAMLAKYNESPIENLSENDARRLGASDQVLGGCFEVNAATVQPAKLGLGLRSHALSLGVRIYEHSPLTGLQRRQRPVVETSGGRVQASKVVIAMNAWGTMFPELRKFSFALAADMIATDPADAELRAIDWDHGVGFCDSHLSLGFWRNTVGRRVVFGKGVGRLAFGGNLSDHFDGPSPRAVEIEQTFRRYYPTLNTIPVASTWTGPIDRTMKALPVFGRLGGHRDIVFGIGFSGEGVVQTVVGSRIVSALVRGVDDEWSRSGLVRDQAEPFPSEPFRYVGGNIVRRVIHRMDRLQDQGKKPDVLTRTLAKIAPPGALPPRD